jgi:hypothetical protein
VKMLVEEFQCDPHIKAKVCINPPTLPIHVALIQICIAFKGYTHPKLVPPASIAYQKKADKL